MVALTISIFILLNLLLNINCQNCYVPEIDNKKVEAICFNWKTTTSGIIDDGNGAASSSARVDFLADSCVPSAAGIILRCKIGYKNKISEEGDSILNICKGGKWKYENINSENCESICGKLFQEELKPTSKPLLFKGNEVDIKLAPWHVAIYRNSSNTFEQICGGTIIHSNIIVSAGHCFYDYSKDDLSNPSKFSIGAGKRYRDYEANEQLSQFARVKTIFVPDTFQPEPLRSDIAVLVLDRHFKYNPVIAPVCLDWDLSSHSDHYDRLSAVLYGWGHTSPDEIASSTLLKINLKTIESTDCKKLVDRNYRPDISRDRFCAINDNNATACGGDSGGGLITMREGYKLTGVVSVGLHKELYCTDGFVTVFTKVRVFQDFIKSIVSKNRNEEQNAAEQILKWKNVR
ncbi:chymotrypsin-C-like [Condylostylus longicornis]|uniref:chymotrypsin-C-like n=1 Tax=Condylostylus longicornis TaxID=2530218 RepID=UPI00244DA45B|nr:chymotrypsin-C-like [Condylostylus longicornis]